MCSVDMVVRAALNDSLLLAWFPWVFLVFDRLLDQGANPGWPRRLALAVLCLAGVLLTHTFALISFAPLLVTFVLFCLVRSWRLRPGDWRQLIARILLAGAGGIGALLVCATFLIPLFVEGQHLQQQVYVANTYDFRRHFVYFGQFFSPFWGFGYSDDPAGSNDSMSFQVGLMALLLGMVAVYLLWRHPVRRGLLIYLIGMTAALLLIMTPAAAPLWEALPPLAVIQFPWRLLALVAFTISALGGLATWKLWAEQESNSGGLLLIGLLVILGSMPYLQAQLQPVEPWREDGRAIYQFEREHLDMLGYTEWVQEPFQESPMSKDYAAESYAENHGRTDDLERFAVIQGAGRVLSNESRGSSFSGDVQIDEPAVVRIHVYNFPGWQVTVDGAPVVQRVSGPHGLMEVDVPVGEHRIDVRMGSTPPRRLGTAISWAMVVVVLGLAAWSRRKG